MHVRVLLFPNLACSKIHIRRKTPFPKIDYNIKQHVVPTTPNTQTATTVVWPVSARRMRRRAPKRQESVRSKHPYSTLRARQMVLPYQTTLMPRHPRRARLPDVPSPSHPHRRLLIRTRHLQRKTTQRWYRTFPCHTNRTNSLTHKTCC